MKKNIRSVVGSLSLCGLAALSLTGCATQNSVKMAQEARLAYEAFLKQPRDFQPLAIHGSNMTFTVNGANSIVMSAPLNPLEVMPRDPDAVGRIADAAKNTVLGAAGIYTLGKVATTPTVVTQPAPTIVRPEIVQVPAAAAASP
jgi:hypothetical protein